MSINPPSQGSSVWQTRHDALHASINASLTRFGKADVPRKNIIQGVLNGLAAFASRHFEVFYKGFSGTENYTLQESREYPPQYVFTVVLDQIATDLTAIQRAAEQRLDSALSDRLFTADTLVRDALQLAKDNNLLPNDDPITVLTYFHKAANIRIVPYARVALVGIPFSALWVDRDLLAIPHEVGHYVFWKGEYDDSVTQQPIRRYMSDIEGSETLVPTWARSWSEEIFADVYGCLIAGAPITFDFQDLQLAFDQKRFLENDGEHPIPFLRPIIYSKVLNTINLEWGVSLLEYWKKRLNLRPIPNIAGNNPFNVHDGYIAGMEKWISVSSDIDVSKPIDRLIQSMLDIIAGGSAATATNYQFAPFSWWDSSTLGQPPTELPRVSGASSDPFYVYNHFSEQLKTLSVASEADLSPAEDIKLPWDAFVQGQGIFDDSYFSNGTLQLAGMVPSGATDVPQQKNTWLPVLAAGGWATKGPVTRWFP